VFINSWQNPPDLSQRRPVRIKPHTTLSQGIVRPISYCDVLINCTNLLQLMVYSDVSNVPRGGGYGGTRMPTCRRWNVQTSRLASNILPGHSVRQKWNSPVSAMMSSMPRELSRPHPSAVAKSVHKVFVRFRIREASYAVGLFITHMPEMWGGARSRQQRSRPHPNLRGLERSNRTGCIAPPAPLVG
jgi:hypothetical protein